MRTDAVESSKWLKDDVRMTIRIKTRWVFEKIMT